MNLIVSLSLIIAFVLAYMLMIQIFTISFRITGLTKEKARFQVISILTNSGYTTNESELITSSRSRRKIAKVGMIVGTIFNVVIASLFINTLLSINDQSQVESLKILGIYAGSFILFMIIIRLPFMRKLFEKIIEKIVSKAMKKRLTKNIITEVDSYGNKLIAEIFIVNLPNELENVTISDAGIKEKYNIMVLTIQRNNRNVNVSKDTRIQKGDKVVVFGTSSSIKDLFEVNEKIKDQKEEIVNTVHVIEDYGPNSLVEVNIKNLPDVLDGASISDIKIKEKYHINVLTIKRKNKNIRVDAETTIEVGDHVVLIGPYDNILNIFVGQK